MFSAFENIYNAGKNDPIGYKASYLVIAAIDMLIAAGIWEYL